MGLIGWDPSQCSRLKPSYEVHFQELWRRQSKNIKMKHKTQMVIQNLCMNYKVYVSNTIWRIKNEPFNSTSCSDNTLRFHIFVWTVLEGQNMLRISSDVFIFNLGLPAFWRVVLRKVCFEGLNPVWKGSQCFEVQPVPCGHLQFFFVKWGHILYVSPKWLVILLKSWTLAGYFSNSTSSSVTSFLTCRLLPFLKDVLYPW